MAAFDRDDDRPEARELLDNIKREHGRLRDLLAEASSHWGYEDSIYRFLARRGGLLRDQGGRYASRSG